MAFSEPPDRNRASLNLPPTYEQMQAQQAESRSTSRLHAVGNGARSVMRWVSIVRGCIAMVVGFGMAVFGIWLIAGDPPGADGNLRTNAWGILLFGLFAMAVSAWILKRALSNPPKSTLL